MPAAKERVSLRTPSRARQKLTDEPRWQTHPSFATESGGYRNCAENPPRTADDPGCVKTPKARKPLEWSFSDRSKSNALKNFRDHNRDLKKCLFYRVFASPRFYTTKTHLGHQQPILLDAPASFHVVEGSAVGLRGSARGDANNPLVPSMMPVRWLTNRSRTRCSACRSS
jgi:hypothetical protein